MNIKVLGSGCTNCKKLLEHVNLAVDMAEIDAEVDYVTDFMEIAKYNLMRTPGLVINQKVVSFGKVLKPEEVLVLIKENM